MQSRTPTEPFTKSGHSPLEPIGLHIHHSIAHSSLPWCHQPGNYFMILSKNIIFKNVSILNYHLILQLLPVGDP